MIRFYGFPGSTNVERVALALAHKNLPTEWVEIDPQDRTEVRRVSGQDLVPVIVDGTKVVSDSMTIVKYLEDAYPRSPKLYPEDRARGAEVEVFVDWFNRAWKRAPNAIATELAKPEGSRDEEAIFRWGGAMQASLDVFESLLTGREHLMGAFGAADIAAFPFVKYAAIPEDRSSYLFHKVLSRYQSLGASHTRVAAWIARVDARPRA